MHEKNEPIKKQWSGVRAYPVLSHKACLCVCVCVFVCAFKPFGDVGRGKCMLLGRMEEYTRLDGGCGSRRLQLLYWLLW